MPYKNFRQMVLLIGVLSSWSAAPLAAEPYSLGDADHRRITVRTTASPITRSTAETLARYLSTITGEPFSVELLNSATDGPASPSGIIVGLVEAWPNLPGTTGLDPHDPLKREAYMLRSSRDGLHLIGATDAAVTHAIWDMLFRLGHRQYLPGQLWEHVPRQRDASIDLDVLSAPDFVQRHIRQGGGDTRVDKQPVEHWEQVNRLGSAFHVNMSHVYARIRIQRPQVFKEHPEYMALVDGKRADPEDDDSKFCNANPGLRDVVAQWAVDHLTQRRMMDGVSMEPSDGYGWCECEDCQRLGSVTDQAHSLASHVAEAINQHFDTPKYVGVLAYGYHSPPPSPDVRLHPRTIVSVTQGFLRGGWTFNDLLDAWHDRVAMLGSYDYLGVVQWSWSLPGDGRATRRNRPKQIIPFLYDRNVRIYIAEREGNWGPAGFNLFMTARLLWDHTEGRHTDRYFDEFLQHMFGPAQEPMRLFFDQINGDHHPLLSQDMIGRMYRHLHTASQSNASADIDSDQKALIQQRIDDLTLYTRYVELYVAYKAAEDSTTARATHEALLRLIWRMRSRLMIHADELYRRLGRRDDRLAVPKQADYRVKEPDNPWKSSEPFTSEQVAAMRETGIANNAIYTFEPVSYEPDLAPAYKLPGVAASDKVGTFGDRGATTRQMLCAWLDKSQPALRLNVTGGLIRHYRDRGDVRIKLIKAGEPFDSENATPLDTAAVPPDGETRTVQLTSDQGGLHRLELTDGGDMTRLEWEAGQPLTLWGTRHESTTYLGPWTLCFYVPKGTKRVAGYVESSVGQLLTPMGETAYDFRKIQTSGYFDVPVPTGMDGQLWWLDGCKRRVILMTVPPALARSGRELLLPQSVIKQDLAP